MSDRLIMFTTRERPIRIGAVSYLNSKPLIEDLAVLASDAELILDFPSRLADDLSAGDLDVALIPSAKFCEMRTTKLSQMHVSRLMAQCSA